MPPHLMMVAAMLPRIQLNIQAMSLKGVKMVEAGDPSSADSRHMA